MPFPIDFMASDQTPTQDQIEQTAGTILRGGAGDPFGRMTKPDGGVFDFDDGTIWVQQLSPDTCAVIFEAARVTDTFLNVGVGDFAPLQIKGSKARPWKVFGKPVLISNPAELCTQLQKDMDGRSPRVTRVGAVKPDPFANYVADDDPHPPPEPGAEARLTHDASGVAAQCETLTRKEWDGSRFTVVRWLTTQDPKWGVIWRADIAPTRKVRPSAPGPFGDVENIHMRLTCWRDRSTGKLARAKRPLEALEVFGDKTALAPLAGADVVSRK